MTLFSGPQFDLLRERLQRLPFALTLSDLSQRDHPLIFVNEEFKKITGYGDEMLGQNCRFLQDDLENDRAKAEIRAALENGRRLQVVLHNRRKNGDAFYNMLLLERIEEPGLDMQLAIGSQFDLGAEVDDRLMDAATLSIASRAQTNSVALGLERRRILADAAVRTIRSWIIVNAIAKRD